LDDFYGGSGDVHDEYGCMLQQTNISSNNNKFYAIQLVSDGGSYKLFTRYGRTGEKGRTGTKGPFGEKAGITNFKKQFKIKTGNDWDSRDSFKRVPKKYVPVDVVYEEEEDLKATLRTLNNIDNEKKLTILPCTLDEPTSDLVKLIFDNDMFKKTDEKNFILIRMNYLLESYPVLKFKKDLIF